MCYCMRYSLGIRVVSHRILDRCGGGRNFERCFLENNILKFRRLTIRPQKDQIFLSWFSSEPVLGGVRASGTDWVGRTKTL